MSSGSAKTPRGPSRRGVVRMTSALQDQGECSHPEKRGSAFLFKGKAVILLLSFRCTEWTFLDWSPETEGNAPGGGALRRILCLPLAPPFPVSLPSPKVITVAPPRRPIKNPY